MSTRDDLAQLLVKRAGDHIQMLDSGPEENAHSVSIGLSMNWAAIADIILAAGFHRDRTIDTAEELDALAPWAVIRDACEDVWEKWVDVYKVDIPVWVTPGVEERKSGVFVPMLPVTVLHEGASDE